MGVARRRRQVGVAQQHLDHADVDAALQQMGGEAVPQDVDGHLLADPRRRPRRPAGRMQRRRLDRAGRVAPRKQPLLWTRQPPVGAQDRQELRRQHHVALLAALAVLDADHHPAAVDIGDPEAGDLRDPQPGGIGCRQRGAGLQAGHGLEEPHHLVGAQHHRQTPRLAGVGDPLGDLRHPERHAVEEPQRRHRLVEARPCHALRREVDLIGANVLQRQRLRGSAEEPAELRHRVDVGSLRRRREVADRHVLDHAATKRAGLGHRKAPVWKGVSTTQTFQSGAPPAKQSPCRAAASFNP